MDNAAEAAPMFDDFEFGRREPVGKAQRDHHEEARDREEQAEDALKPAAAAPTHLVVRFEIAHPILAIVTLCNVPGFPFSRLSWACRMFFLSTVKEKKKTLR